MGVTFSIGNFIKLARVSNNCGTWQSSMTVHVLFDSSLTAVFTPGAFVHLRALSIPISRFSPVSISLLSAVANPSDLTTTRCLLLSLSA